MTYTVYEARNTVNNKLYIGITGRPLKVRKARHFRASASGGGAVIGAAIRHYGRDNFTFKTLLLCPDISYANYAERALIALYKPEYNLTAGGAGVSSYKLSDEAKKKISLTQKGNKHWLGKKHNQDTLAKMSASRTSYWASREHSQKPYQKKNSPRRGRLVACKGTIYENLVYAAKVNGLTRDQLRTAMKRKNSPGLIGGLRFSYVDWLVDNIALSAIMAKSSRNTGECD